MSYKLSTTLALILFVLLLTLVPFMVLGQDYQPLAPVPGLTTGVEPGIGGFVRGAVNFAIGIAAALAVIMIVIGGIQYMLSESVGGKENAKQTIGSAIGGLLLALASVVILQTINPDIVSLNFAESIERLKEAARQKQDGVTPGEVVSGAPHENEQQTRNILESSGITINNQCPLGENRSNCTNVGGLPQNAVEGLVQLRHSCGNFHNTSYCTIIITGGTEPGHQTHGPGRSVVDLRPNQALNSYIRGNPDRPPHNYRITRNGVEFTFERAGEGHSTGDHWHVRF